MQNKMENFGKKDLSRLFTAASGVLICSLGLNLFVVPAGLYSGGLLGISQILRTLLVRFANLNLNGFDVSGIINLTLNIPLFFLAYRSISRGFFYRTLICVALQTICLTTIPIPSTPLVEDTLTASLIGGIICGAGAGITLKGGGSGGGLDILGIYFTKKYQDFSVGRLALFANLIIYVACAVLFDITVVIYCVIYTAVTTLMMDKTHTQNINTQVMIFTKQHPKDITEYIIKDLERGVTCWEGRGGYTDKTTHIIFTVISKHELRFLKRKLHEIDPQAFLASKENVEIAGLFKKHL